jgi:ATP-dependent Clp protease adaptor protein ClpS
MAAAAFPGAVGARAAVTAPVVAPDVGSDVRDALDRPWQVVVWDDPVNLMSYVVMVLRRVFGYDRPTAERLMLQVHHEGRAVVAAEPKERAEHHVGVLHAYGLRATMEPGS